MSKLRQQWSAISLEKKLGMFVAPVVVAVASGVLVPILIGTMGDNEDHTGPPAARTQKHEALQLLDITVAGGDRPEPQRIDVTVRNVGSTVAVITRATFTINDVALIKSCEPRSGGGLDPTVHYNVLLPPAPRQGASISSKVSQQIAANQADRFTFTFDVPYMAMRKGMYLYSVRMRLFHDVAAEPIDAGQALISVPYLPLESYFLPADTDPSDLLPATLGCYANNEAGFRRLLSQPGARAPGLTLKIPQGT